jgi:hypothetical protein
VMRAFFFLRFAPSTKNSSTLKHVKMPQIKSVQTLDFSRRSKLRFIHSIILHFSNYNIHGSINDDEFIKNTRRFLKIYPRETSRREVKLWSGLSRYFDTHSDEFCCLTRTEKKGDRSFVRSFVCYYTTRRRLYTSIALLFVTLTLLLLLLLLVKQEF